MKKTESMERVNALIHHPVYQECYERTKELEKDRIFCRHQMDHLLDVARIAYIINLEENLKIEKELIYTAAVLHDIGKWEQYDRSIPHEEAGERIAGRILRDLPENLQFTDVQIREILTAIRGHRRLRRDPEPLERILYTADKASRQCFSCPAQKKCDWSPEKKNMEIQI